MYISKKCIFKKNPHTRTENLLVVSGGLRSDIQYQVSRGFQVTVTKYVRPAILDYDRFLVTATPTMTEAGTERPDYDYDYDPQHSSTLTLLLRHRSLFAFSHTILCSLLKDVGLILNKKRM